jgi:hypothetical protein
MPTTQERRKNRNWAPEDIVRSVQDSPDINLQDLRTEVAKDRVHEATAVRAYELYLGRGGEHGHDLDDWLRAESEIQQRGPSES